MNIQVFGSSLSNTKESKKKAKKKWSFKLQTVANTQKYYVINLLALKRSCQAEGKKNEQIHAVW